MNNDKTIDELLLDFQTRLQGVANGLATRLSSLISSTDVALLKTIVRNLPRAKAGKISLRDEMKKLEKLVKKIEQIRAPGFDAARDLAFQVAIKTASATSANEAGIIDAQTAVVGKKKTTAKAKTLPDKTIDEIVKYEPIDGNSIEKWFKNLQEKDLRDITQTVFRAASERVSVEEIARRIRGTKENNYTDGLLQTTRDGATALSRTLINGVANNVRLETIRENTDVIDGVRFVSTLDGKTCPFCASYDGKIWPPAEIDAIRRPPLHMNCRCCVVSHVDLHDKDGKIIEIGTRPAANADFDKLAEDAYNEKARQKGLKRRFADLSSSSRLKYYYEAQKEYEQRTGKPAYRQVAARTTFKEYFEKQDDAFKRSWLGAKRYELYKDGALDWYRAPTPHPRYAETLKALETQKAQEIDRERQNKEEENAALESLDFPCSLEELTIVQKLGGSTGAQMVKDGNGNLYVMKRGGSAGGDAAEHLRNECAVDAFYRSLCIDVPEFRVYNTKEGPVKLSRFIEGGQSLGDWWESASEAEKKELRGKLRKAFDVDVLTGNWDVIGMSADNVLVDKNGRPWRIDNGGAFGFRAQGARKNAADWEDGWIDDLWTMAGRSAQIEKNIPTTCTKYIGADIDVLSIAQNAANRDWSKALASAPAADRKILEKRLLEIKQLAARGDGFVQNGYSRDWANGILDYSYLASKDGLREACAFKINDSEGPSKHIFGWFRSGSNKGATPLQKKYISFTDYIDQRFNGAATFIGENNEAQGIDSYSKKACRTKYSRLLAKGLDASDVSKFPDFESFAEEAKKNGYYLGEGRNDQLDAMKNVFGYYRGKNEEFDLREHARKIQQYNAAIQIALENCDFQGNNKSERSVILIRTEEESVVSKNGRISLKPGDVSDHLRGPNESHSNSRITSVFGKEITILSVPYSRINAFYFPERYSGNNNPQFYGDNENEFNADTSGITAIYCGSCKRESVHYVSKRLASDFYEILKNWEKKH